MATRRKFLQFIPVAGVAVVAACSKKEEAPAAAPAEAAPAPAAEAAPAAAPEAAAPAAPAEALTETDAQAVSLGFVLEAAKADKTKFPTYAEGQKCSGCALYAGAADAATAPCGLFGGKLVPAGGWCSAFAAKPAA